MVGSRAVMACHRSAEVRASPLRVRRGICWGVVTEGDMLIVEDMSPVSLVYGVACLMGAVGTREI